jgi:hypothetical protein
MKTVTRRKKKITKEKENFLTILPFGVLNGQAEEYSKLVLGRSTGCSPTTPIPLPYRKTSIQVIMNMNLQRFKTGLYSLNWIG